MQDDLPAPLVAEREVLRLERTPRRTERSGRDHERARNGEVSTVDEHAGHGEPPKRDRVGFSPTSCKLPRLPLCTELPVSAARPSPYDLASRTETNPCGPFGSVRVARGAVTARSSR